MKSMFDAIRKNDTVALHKLIYKDKQNINEKYLDDTPFLFASKVSDVKTLVWLAQNGADISIENNHYSALHYVIFAHRGTHEQQNEKITYLLENGFEFYKPEFASVFKNDIEFFKEALKTRDLRDIKDRFGTKILHYAAALNKLEIVKLIVENRKKNGIPIDERDEAGDTPFLASAGSGHINVMEYFLNNGATIKEKNNNGYTPLLKATKNGQLDAVKWLLTPKGFFRRKGGGASIKEKDNFDRTALLIAADNGETPLVEYLLTKGASIKKKDKDGDTPGIKAAQRGHIETLQVLIKNGTSIKERDLFGSTLFLVATRFGQFDMVKWFLKLPDASDIVKEKDNEGNTPVLEAAFSGELEIVKLLLQEGKASIFEKDIHGTTVIIKAAISGNVKLVRYLREDCGASITQKNNYGITPLVKAVNKEWYDVVEYLLDNGASVKDNVSFGNSVFEMAIKKNNLKLIRILIEKGLKTDKKLVEVLLDALEKKDFESIKKLTKTTKDQENDESEPVVIEVEGYSHRKSVSSQPPLFFSNGKQDKNVSQNEEVSSSYGLRNR